MNDVGGSDSGTGLRAVKSSRTSDANFEYDDSEWDVGIGNLIIDLDADIEKNNEANRSNSSSANNTLNTSPVSTSNSSTIANNNNSSPGNSSLPSSSSASQMHIPHSSANSSGTSSSNSNANNNPSTGKGKSSNSSLPSGGKATASPVVNSSDLPGSMEHSAIVDKGLKMKIKRTKAGTKSGADAKHEIVKSDLSLVTSSTTSGSNSNSNSSSGSIKTGSGGLTDSISSKSAHSSSSHKDKDKIKDSSSMIMIDAERDTGAGATTNHSGSGSTSTNNGIKDTSGNNDQGNKGKAPRKGSTHKKVKSGNGNSNSNKKDERNTNTNANSLDTKGNSGTSASSVNHTKDGKDFFTSTTVSLNVPTVIPNSSSSFAKTTLKVPTATTASIIPNSIPIHPSLDSSSSASRNLGHLSSNASPWSSTSTCKSVEKNSASPAGLSLGLPVEKGQGNTSPSYGKKARTFMAGADKGASNQEDGLSSGLGHMMQVPNISYRSASISDLGSPTGPLSSVNHQGVPMTQSSSFVNSCKPSRSLQQPPSTQDVCVGTSVATSTEPECLGPCDPGTSITLDGLVWHETESGVLVINVTWRGKTYVGTLLDCTKNDWAPPRFCDSPTSDLEMRMPKNRGKRGRGQAATPVNEVPPDPRPGNAKLRNGAKGRRGSASNTAFVAPASPVKGEQWPKRKTRGSENEGQDEPSPPTPKNAKRPKISKEERKERQSNSPAPGSDTEKSSGPTSPVLIECPEPNCSKKYKHINGLRYHQSHAHCNNFAAEDSDSNASTTSTQLTSLTENPTVNEKSANERRLTAELETALTNESPRFSLKGDDSSTSPAKISVSPTNNGPVESRVEEKTFNLNSSDIEMEEKDTPTTERVEPPILLNNKISSKNGKTQKEISPVDKEDLKSIVDTSNSKESPAAIPIPIPSRPAILTVPVPYVSLPNRPAIHQHPMNIPISLRDDLARSRDPENNVMKPTPSPIESATSTPPHVPPKGIPWQPHAHTSQNHTIPMISNTACKPNLINVPLNIPLSGNDKESNKEKERTSSTEGQGKKNKHKKKSKDKNKDGKSKSGESRDSGKGRSGVDSSRSQGSIFGSNIPISDSADAADDLRMSKRDDIMKSKNDLSGGNSGDNRDTQSPAYSDISDANDSGDTELNVGVPIVKDGLKNNVVPPEIKKDTPAPVTGGHPIPNFFPGFYSPYLDSNHSTKLGDKPSPPEEQSEKEKAVKPIPHPPHVQGHGQGQPPVVVNQPPPPSTQINSEDRGRSPKMDFHPKYLPHPQHQYFHYPYSNYHFEQGQYNNIMPENAFNSGRAFASVEEREKERELIGELGKGKLPEKDCLPMGMTIKQEPGERHKDPRSMPMPMGKPNNEEKPVEIKSEFGSDYRDPKSVPHFIGIPCSKHSKDPKQRDEMNKNEPPRLGSLNDKSKLKDGSASGDSEKDLKEREREREKIEGSKPTMETQGPPPPPTAGPYAYIPQPYLQGNPFGIHFDPGHPLYRQVLVPGHYGGPPYMGHPGPMPRFQPPGATPLPEDLSRPSTSSSGPPPKALDMLQHHASQYYQVHKIHELSERALKSPSPQVAQREREAPSGPLSSNTPASPVGLNVPNVIPNSRNSANNSGSASGSVPKPADLSKDSKMGPSGPLNESSRSPPTQHHVHSHTHHHTHVGIGYPIIPAFPAPHSPHYGVLPTPSPAASVIPPFPSQKPN